MSLLFFDGFDDYAATNAAPDDAMLASGYARAGNSRSRSETPNGLGRSLGKRATSQPTVLPLGGEIEQLVVGFHYHAPDGVLDVIANFFSENLLGTYRSQFSVILNGQRGITVTNNIRTLVYGASAPALISPGVWYHIEVKVNHSTNEVIVRLNQETVVVAAFDIPFDATNVLELPATTDARAGGFKAFDNLYVLDCETGVAPFNDFLGETYVFTSGPISDAGPNDFEIVGTADPDNYQAVDDDFVNDGDYLTSIVDGARDWFGTTNVPADTLEVYAVGIVHRTRKGSGPAQYRSLARIGATEVANPIRSVSNTFSARLDIMHEKPGGGAWTVEDANALEIGIEIIEPA